MNLHNEFGSGHMTGQLTTRFMSGSVSTSSSLSSAAWTAILGHLLKKTKQDQSIIVETPNIDNKAL